MIQLLSTTYTKPIAYCLLLIFMRASVPVYGRTMASNPIAVTGAYNYKTPINAAPNKTLNLSKSKSDQLPVPELSHKAKITAAEKNQKENIGGPGQPEMSSFKSVGTDNMVNLFTGDFSYNIPLMDVGGYPINIFYDGNITMEQEASWVGLGWNINPGTISRNMRGVPDDFNGEDILTQTQKMKPNITWGVSLGADLELVGIKSLANFSGSVGASLGVSYNNYLGPALDFGVKGGTNFKLAGKAGSEKSGASIGAGISANVSSRNGLTLSPNVSLSASHFVNDKKISGGLSLATSYNSKTGIKALQISEQVSFNKNETVSKCVDGETNSKDYSSTNSFLNSNSISFAKPSYIPALRMPITNEAYSGHFQLGGALFGVYGSAEVEVYKQTSTVEDNDIIQKKPLVGYLYYQKAVNNPNAVMDFTRLNDKEVTPNTPIISAPQYTYDVFSIQGEGTGGSIRAYRNDLGYVRDNTTRSQDKSLSVGGDIGIPGHFGANFNTINTPTIVGEWGSGNKLKFQQATVFQERNSDWENVYVRNPGETSVINNNQYTRIGGTDLVRYQLGGSPAMPTIEPKLQTISSANVVTGTTNLLSSDPTERKKRTQVTTFLTAEEAAKVGLDSFIKSYNATTILDVDNNLLYDTIQRDGYYRKKHHISEIDVTEASGKRYIYGIPVYNIIQKDFSFSVNNTETGEGQVAFDPKDASKNSDLLDKDSKTDGFVQITETPAYAHSFLLTGLLSPDYVDITGNGITEDDLGNAVKFNYTRIKQGTQWANHKWRTPLTAGGTNLANFNVGNLTEDKDDKGLVTYGERESWYAHSIESKTMVALFTLENRDDGKGTVTEFNGVNAADNSQKRLKKIDLFSKADLKKNGLANAKPIKTVWFTYSYTLCKGTPDNTSGEGKLTLESIYFTFNGKNKANKNKYVFSYGNTSADNPVYAFKAADRWGNYKLPRMNPNALKNADFPYAIQNKDTANAYAGAWALKKILLPSGGQIEVSYESDDYAFVQNRRAATMMEIVGLGNSETAFSDKLYRINGNDIVDNDYVFIKVPQPCADRKEVFEKYLSGVEQLAFKTAVKMPKGMEYIPSYATISDYGVYDATRIWVKVNKVDGVSPLSLSALEYLRQQLPGQAFPGYDVSKSSGLQQVGEMMLGMLDGLKGAFKNPVNYLRSQGKAQTIILEKSFVRLNDPDGYKYGGGHRVKAVKLKDNWQVMTGQYTSAYGQEYNYETTEVFNGTERTISSGVASYEPGIGGDENPFQTIVQIANELPLGPTSYGAIEMPVLDAFFPAPVVGYSKVTVRSLRKGNEDPTKKSRSGIGKQVTEFYTAKDFPVKYRHSSFDPTVDKQFHQGSLLAFFYKYAFDSRALSQGFLVETNDMHGKMKSQASYAEGDEKTRIAYSENIYRNTGNKGLGEKFDFVYASRSGVVEEGNMGIDVELMTDTREFSVKSTSLEIQGQVDLFPVLFPFWLPFVWPVSGNSENTYRAVTTTKVVNYHGILDSVVVIDKGSMVSTKNLVYDAETGEVVVNKTNNEFDLPVYNVSYPAYWAYSGMGLAYKNIDAVYTGVNFKDGKITSGNVPNSILESGDELYLINAGKTPTDACAINYASDDATRLWVFDKNKNTSSLTNTAPSYVFMNSKGNLYTKDGVSFRIIRSGKRNMLSATVATATLMANPITVTSGIRKLVIGSASKVINAGAVEYKEKWKNDNDLFQKYSIVNNPNSCIPTEQLDCNGYWEKSINPYRKGLFGNFRVYRNLVFYGDRAEKAPLTATNIKQNGFISSFKHYWNFNTSNNLIPDVASTKWVWNSQITKFNARGMELETKDALDIYTSAQYGFNKSMPVAITNSAKYDEMFFDGFEDVSFDEAINNSSQNACAQKHIAFNNIPNSSIFSTDSLEFNAHTGKYIWKVQPGIASKIIDINNGKGDLDYKLDFPSATATINATYKSGVNNSVEVTPANTIPYSILPTTYGYSTGATPDFSASYKVGVDLSTNTNCYWGACCYKNINFKFKMDGYYKVAGDGLNNFKIFIQRNQISPYGDISLTVKYYRLKVLNNKNELIIDVEGNGSNWGTESTDVLSTFILGYSLCKGDYKVELTIDTDISNSVRCDYYISESYRIFTIGIKKPFLVTVPPDGPVINSNLLLTKTNCAFSKPIQASDTLFNPTFSLPKNKKMLFSAWVKEPCGNPSSGIPCTQTTYANNEVQLQFNDGSSTPEVLKPSGPIIEGWQRYEGYFAAPATATNMTLSFVNKSSSPIYFDDIRIHPYNANMKSYVYDPISLRLVAELDGNNYARFYEYDEEGTLIRTKVETKEGIKTLTETRSFKQQAINAIQ